MRQSCFNPGALRVLYVIQQAEYSGAEVMHLPLMQADPDALLACPPDSRTEAWARDAGIPTVPLAYRTLRNSGGLAETLRSVPRGVATARALRRLLRAHPERDVVYAIAPRSGMVASLAALGLGRSVVWYVSDRLPPPPLRHTARALARASCRRAIATSRTIAEDFAPRGALAARTTVVHPGTDVERFAAVQPDAGAPRAGVLGHVSPVKRTDLALDVAALVAERAPEFSLSVVGRALYREEDFALERELRERAEHEPRLRGHVEFRGYSTDVAGELARLGVLLHCRDDEPFGIAIIEAMAAGVPVVVPASAGPAEIVRDGTTGLLYRPGDARAAADAVLRLIGDRELAGRLAAAARREAGERFSYARQVAELRGVLDGLG